ncbi:MAG TPA: HEAT repeat domain-containing protein [Verrucomicrobiota bacterium]|nr:HEAT repeat domain-containing protein [Verrucomicrobiota bacterium]HNU52684.1 HEAT repeat domain-containing protein [Verrucomicrobiota bacterium]
MNTGSSILTTAAIGLAGSASAAPADAVSANDLLTRIRSTDDAVRGPAWQGAGPAGAPAVAPLADLMNDADFEIARSAKRAIEVIVRHAGRPGAAREREAVQAALVRLLKHAKANVRRHAVWMLSEVGDDDAVGPMAALLTDGEAREDARCALTRIPGAKATKALEGAMRTASGEFQVALADSLRARGEKVSDHPTRKLVPTRQTRVTAG